MEGFRDTEDEVDRGIIRASGSIDEVFSNFVHRVTPWISDDLIT
jgi:hypothetical protein